MKKNEKKKNFNNGKSLNICIYDATTFDCHAQIERIKTLVKGEIVCKKYYIKSLLFEHVRPLSDILQQKKY